MICLSGSGMGRFCLVPGLCLAPECVLAPVCCTGTSTAKLVPVFGAGSGLELGKSAGASIKYWCAGSTGRTGHDWEVLVPVSPVHVHFADVET